MIRKVVLLNPKNLSKDVCFFILLGDVDQFFFQEIVDEIDEDESGLLEFPEFVQLAAKFLIEEDEEQMKWELKEAFRIYDKHGKEFFFYVKSMHIFIFFLHIFL